MTSLLIAAPILLTLTLLVSGLAGRITPDSLQHCESKIRTRTTGRRVVS